MIKANHLSYISDSSLITLVLTLMSNCRLYGKPPFKIALIHGGPGDPGSLKELAEILSSDYGILEPLQTADSVNGQIEELKVTLDQYADLPIILIGHSWGAMLGYLFAAKYPTSIQKLIMVSSGLFDGEYAKNIMMTSLSRLSKEKQSELNELMLKLDDNCNDSDALFHKFGNIMKEADSFDPIQLEPGEVIKGQNHIFNKVWPEAAKMRETGELLTVGKKINCPVIAIHGDYDPHPYQGVQIPLSTVLKDFTFILLNNCGHEPWNERQAKDQFISLLRVHLHDFNIRNTQ